VRFLAEPETYDEVERLPGSGQLPGAPRCHRGRFSSSSWAASKERAAASVLEVRTPHRSSCSRRARKRRRPSTEIRLGVHLPLLARESSLAFVPQPPFACERDPPTERGMEKYKLHPRLTRGTFTDKGAPLYPEMTGGAMARSIGGVRPSMSDAGVKLRVPTSSRTSPAARRACHPARH
jgi:hypothetical protein